MSTSEQPLPKRKRADEFEDVYEPAAPVDPVRSDIWYRDGNIVLQAGITQFKVYQGALGEASSVFKDMFSFPQPPAADMELVEGCPVVHVSDSAEELKIVLQAIFQLQYVTGGEKLSLAVVSAFGTLGAKYDIGRLYAAGKRTLYQSFPMTLEELDALTDWKYIEIHDDTSH
ncbi:hypothetical protein FIBSPDRAFT_1037856 [Athelia psychrophila]|uniref:BTB domain-containing protein n=1 Tax=Athelia psychrophila TaxID=1759441 RepID=A0A166TS38_9AGAM|nr:hypothetical protein FIBSPDRAFT_1037856 [Fibularhizoctonia sp. CBS 109695]